LHVGHLGRPHSSALLAVAETNASGTRSRVCAKRQPSGPPSSRQVRPHGPPLPS